MGLERRGSWMRVAGAAWRCRDYEGYTLLVHSLMSLAGMKREREGGEGGGQGGGKEGKDGKMVQKVGYLVDNSGETSKKRVERHLLACTNNVLIMY